MAELGLAQRELATVQVLTQEVIKTSEIEGERLNLDVVRRSIARRLGVDIGALAVTDRPAGGRVVDMGHGTLHAIFPPGSCCRRKASAKPEGWQKKASAVYRPTTDQPAWRLTLLFSYSQAVPQRSQRYLVMVTRP